MFVVEGFQELALLVPQRRCVIEVVYCLSVFRWGVDIDVGGDIDRGREIVTDCYI